MVDVHFYEQMSDEELLAELQSQQRLAIQFAEDIKREEYQDEWVQEKCLQDLESLWGEIRYIELVLEERGVKYG